MHKLLSRSHALVLSVCVQPFASQPSLVQGLLSSQLIVAVPVHTPETHLSLSVQGLPSLQIALSLAAR